ncbi:alkaline phosphatase family protein [Frigoribacterium sp. UYMn621]|uniref:alkaline phosphatase family protein n=1 Tax=Frigoribacterium sp. UYMn621 TaxID=3156343 RepID=UPI00339747C8
MKLRSRFTLGALAAVAALALTATAASASTGGHQSDDPSSHRQSGSFDHIFVIMLENHSKSSVIGDANAPYLTGLARQYSMADNYYGVTHPSMPNYIASIAGDNFGIQDDNDQNVINLDRVNLVDQLEAHHISWGAYMEALPANKLDRFGPVFPNGTTASLYAKKHNPFVLFDDIKNDPARMANIKDYSQLSADLNGPKAPQYVWISPDQCNDMHGGVYGTIVDRAETPCPYGSVKDDANDASLKQKADAFVHTAVDTIKHSKAWTNRSAIVIVTDENDFTGNTTTGGWESATGCCDSPYVGAADARISATWPGGTYGGGLIPAIVVTASGPRHFVDHTAYNHYSLLTTIEDNWNLGHLGHAGDTAGGVVAMWPMFTGRK